jgi:uncharacterized protein
VYVMPGLLDHLLFLVLLVLVPLGGRRLGFERLVAAPEAGVPPARIALYRNTLVLEWALAAALAALWLASRRPWTDLHLVLRVTGGLGGVMLGLAVVVGVLARLNRVVPGDTTALPKLERSAGRLARMLPTTGREFGWFAGLAASAGVCEEALYRGFVLWYLGAWAALVVPAPQVFAVAAAASSVVFGLGHAYQGPRNVLVTALVGGFLAAVVWITGSLYAAMLIHALMDLEAGHTSYAAHAAGRTPGVGAPTAGLPVEAGPEA